MGENEIKNAVDAATDEQKSKYGLDPKFLDFTFMTSRSGSIQVNMNNMKENRPTDEDKSRFLLTICDICREAGIELSVSHGGKKTLTLEGGKTETFYSCWPSLWLNVNNATAQAAKAQADELKAEVDKKLATMEGKMDSQFAAIMAALQTNQSASAGTDIPG